MSKPQLDLIKRCIQEEFVEVGWINSVSPKTAESLVNAGILKYDWPPLYEGPPRRSYVRLCKREDS